MRALRPALITILASGVLCAATPASAAPAEDRLRFDFSGATGLVTGSVTDVSGQGNDGQVVTDDGGVLRVVSGVFDRNYLAFPGSCSGDACPQAVLRVADSPSLDAGTRPFTFGADVRLPEDHTGGANVVQKGLWGDDGGQWKLQVDGAKGRPSCVVSGELDGRPSRSTVKSEVSIADGRWHAVACSRTASGVEVSVDGEVTGYEETPAVSVDNDAPVMVGGKNVVKGTDQFRGALDDIFFAVG